MKSLPSQKIFNNLIRTFLFIFCAVPGSFVTIGSTVIFFDTVVTKHNSISNPFLPALWFILGSALVFIGLGKFNKPLYLLVIWSFPTMIFLPIILFEFLPNDFTLKYDGLISTILFPFIFIVPILVKKNIDRYYQSVSFENEKI